MKTPSKSSERAYYKAINFDLDTKMLKAIYPKKHWRSAYDDVRDFCKENGFSHRQGSGYLSNEKLTTLEVGIFTKTIFNELWWLRECVKKIDCTNVGKSFNLIDLYDNTLKQQNAEQNAPQPAKSYGKIADIDAEIARIEAKLDPNFRYKKVTPEEYEKVKNLTVEVKVLQDFHIIKYKTENEEKIQETLKTAKTKTKGLNI